MMMMKHHHNIYRYGFASVLRLWLLLTATTILSLVVVVVDASSAAGTETLVAIVGKDFILIGADSSMSGNGGIAVTASNLDKIAVLVEPFPYNADRRRRTRARGRSSKHLHPLYQQYQQTIVAAAVGNSADSDRLIGILQSQAVLQEYSASVGCDVDYVNLNMNTVNNNDGGYGNGNNGDGDKLDDDGDLNDVDLDPLLDYQPGLTVESMAHFARGQISRSLRSNTRKDVCLLIAGMQPVVSVNSANNSNNNVPAQQQSSLDTDSSCTSTSPTFHSEKLQRQVKQATWGIKNKQVTVEKEEEAAALAAAAASALENGDQRQVRQQNNTQKLEPRLYWLDEYGSLQQIQYGSHGYGSNFILSILDQGYKPNMSKEDATQLLLNCFQQLRTRYIINSPQPPCIKCIDSNGCILLRSD